jgi:hypothetical protein
MKKSLFFGYILTLLLFTAACKKDPDPITESTRGYATGKVTDSKGNPIAGAQVVIDNTMISNSSAVGITDEKGLYKIQLPLVGTFHASANLKRTYNGQQYTLDLDPDNYDEFSIDGAIRNFQWKMTGPKPIEEQGYYGVTIGVNKALESQLYDDYKIEFTLVPMGKLIDGSEGKTLTLKTGQPYTKEYGYLVDIPLGRYRMTAVYVDGSTRIPLKLRKHFSDDPYTPDLQIDFEPQNIWGNNSAFISYREE